MLKFNRKYKLSVQTSTGSILVIEPPFTIDFDITRNVLTSANVCQIRVYNLGKENRNQIRKDISNTGEFRGINLKAGYGENLSTIFAGNISQAWSVREGTNFISQIECFDGGYALANATFHQQFPAGTTQKTILSSMIDGLPNISRGVVRNIEGSISRGNSYSGSTVGLLSELAPQQFFIDIQKAYILGNDECFQGEIQEITDKTGLLGTPVRQETIINVETIFEPRVLIGQLLTIKSEGEAVFNGSYKVISVKHKGTISETKAGDATTSIGLYKGVGSLTLVN